MTLTRLFPSTIFIEPTTACNLRCRMCPIHGRDVGAPPKAAHMDMALYCRLVDEAASHNTQLGEITINPQLRGESPLHPRFPEMLEYAHRRGLRITLSTNGLLLAGDVLDAVADCADYVFFSIDAIRPETYEAIRGAPYEAAHDAVVRLVEARARARRSLPEVYMAFVQLDENEGELGDYMRYCKERTDGILVYRERVADGWYREPFVPPDAVRSACPHLVSSCAVMVDGSVTPCCFIVDPRDALGVIGDGTLEDVYNGEGFQHLRSLHAAGDFEESGICRECNAYPGYPPTPDDEGEWLVLRNTFTTFYLKKR